MVQRFKRVGFMIKTSMLPEIASQLKRKPSLYYLGISVITMIQFLVFCSYPTNEGLQDSQS